MRVEKKPPSGTQPSPADENKKGTSFREALSGSRQQQTQESKTGPANPAAGERTSSGDLAKGLQQPRKSLREDEAAPREGVLSGSFAQPQQQAPAAVEHAQGTAGTESIQRVADEIVVVIRADGAQEVQIEVDSKVLEDLRISVTQKDGEVSVRLMTDSAQTRQMLTQGLPQLMATLQARQVVLAGLNITPRVLPSGAAFPRGSRQGRSGRDREGGRGRR